MWIYFSLDLDYYDRSIQELQQKMSCPWLLIIINSSKKIIMCYKPCMPKVKRNLSAFCFLGKLIRCHFSYCFSHCFLAFILNYLPLAFWEMIKRRCCEGLTKWWLCNCTQAQCATLGGHGSFRLDFPFPLLLAFLRQGPSIQSWLSLNFLCRQSWS